MKKTKIYKNQSGLAHVIPVILAVLVIGVVSFAAYNVGSNKKNSEKASQATSTKSEPKRDEGAKKKTYSFEKTPLKIDIPENWQANIDEKFETGYRGTIKADGGWGINFTADQGGYGGGPGCNLDNEYPESPPCPTWTVLSNDVLPTGDRLVSYSSSNAGKYEGENHCTLIKGSDKVEASEKVGKTFVADLWTCFGAIEANPNPPDGQDIGDTPLSLRLSVVFPYDLDKKATTDFQNDPGYKTVVQALKTLRK